ncbi:MAG TPA: hypothetical protein VIH86_02295, partial [Puia sp.]
MRRLLFLSLIFVLFVCSSTKNHYKKITSLPLLIAWQKFNGTDSTLIETSIINTSLDTIFYLSWECGNEEYYRIDSKEFFINPLIPLESPCWWRNGLIIAKLPPGAIIEKTLWITYNKIFSPVYPKEIKVGFYLFRTNSDGF